MCLAVNSSRSSLQIPSESVLSPVFCPLPGPVFGSKDNFHGLAIFLDTYPNDEATEVSGSGSSFIAQEAVSSQLCVPSASWLDQGKVYPNVRACCSSCHGSW